MSVRHGKSNAPEFAVCGLACDAHESGDWHEPVVYAAPGETVTCAECRAAIDWARAAYTRGYRYQPKDPHA